MFITFEGVDGAGKSTTISELGKLVDFEVYGTPPKRYLEMRESVDRNASAIDHYRFYRDGIIDASDEIQALVLAGKNIVCDRYWMTTYVYHKVMDVDVFTNEFANMIQPDLTIFLFVQKEIQTRRLIHRGMSAGDRRLLEQQQNITEGYFDLLKSFQGRYLAIDTSSIDAKQVARVVHAAI